MADLIPAPKKEKKDKTKVQNAQLQILEKHLKMKLKEIRPLHLDDKLEN